MIIELASRGQKEMFPPFGIDSQIASVLHTSSMLQYHAILLVCATMTDEHSIMYCLPFDYSPPSGPRDVVAVRSLVIGLETPSP